MLRFGTRAERQQAHQRAAHGLAFRSQVDAELKRARSKSTCSRVP
jgi:hypothetical protein